MRGWHIRVGRYGLRRQGRCEKLTQVMLLWYAVADVGAVEGMGIHCKVDRYYFLPFSAFSMNFMLFSI